MYPSSLLSLSKISCEQKHDSGLYECQVSTTPVRSHIVSLQVTEPLTQILGGEDIFVEEGDTMNLTCIVKVNQNMPEMRVVSKDWFLKGLANCVRFC